jgi:hypothetical protein
MKVWTDLLSGDEMVSDSYPHTVTFDGACLEVKSRLITKGAEDYGIAGKSITLRKLVLIRDLYR